MAPAWGASRHASQRGRDVLVIFLALLVRGNCFHSSSQIPHRRACFSRASSTSSLCQTQEGADGGSVPVLLRDVVIEKIEELDGGKVQQVRGLRVSECSGVREQSTSPPLPCWAAGTVRLAFALQQ